MPPYLVFRLYGAMASWGEIAVGEFRPTSDHPGRSAVLGLIGAALGVRRDEEERLRALADGYRIGVRLDAPGQLLRDYHTSQVPASGTGRSRRTYRTRREELLAPADLVSTILSTRDYRCDACATIVVEALPGAPHSLGELAAALTNPVYVLYLGRRSCPPGLPLEPIVVEDAGSILEALAAADAESGAAGFLRPLFRGKRHGTTRTCRLFWEDGMVPGPCDGVQSVPRRDHPLSRRRWQFRDRTEHQAVLAPRTEEG